MSVYNLFDEWVLSPPHKKSRINKYGNVVETLAFQTISHSAFNPLAEIFLSRLRREIFEGSFRKTISQNLIYNNFLFFRS